MPAANTMKLISALFLALLLATACQLNCQECRECVWGFDAQGNTDLSNSECSEWEEYCGEDLRNRQKSDIFECR